MRNPSTPALRLAIIVSHPIQYYAPWFAYLTRHLGACLRVFYLWDFGVTPQRDPGFQQSILWDIDLLAGYDSCFIPNLSQDPGTHHFRGLDNPEIVPALLEWRPDAILLFGYNHSSLLRVITSRRLRKVPLLFRGDSHLLVDKRLSWRWAARSLALPFALRRFAAFLTVGRAHTDYLRRHHVPQREIFFAPHAVDNRRFMSALPQASTAAARWRRELGIPSAHRVVLFAGKFQPKKRPDDLIHAFLAANLADTTLLLVGSGELDSVLRRVAADRPNMVFAPFQNQSLMARTYAACDLFVLPSCGLGESWGLALNEALCCGKAVIVSDHVGCHVDLVSPGRNGLIFRAGDRADLTMALREALSNPARLAQWGAEGQRMVSAYDFSAATRGLRAALNSLPKPAPRSSRTPWAR